MGLSCDIFKKQAGMKPVEQRELYDYKTTDS